LADVEARILTKDGGKIPYYFTGVDISYKGKPAIMGTGINVSERKINEEKIKLSEKRLLKAQEIGKIGNWIQDLKSNKIWASKMAMHIYGLQLEEGELDKEVILDCIIDKEIVLQGRIDLLENNKEYNIEIRIRPADGTPVKYISANAELEKNEQGEPIRIVGTFQDITERKIAQEKIKREKELSDTLINNLPGIVYLYDEFGKFIRWNRNFGIISGYNTKEIKNMKPLDFFNKDQQDVIKERIKTEFKADTRGVELELVTKQNAKIPFYINSMSIEYEGKKCILGIGLNLSERKKAERALQESEKYLTETQAIANLGTYILDMATGNWKGSVLLDKILGIDTDFDKTFEGGQRIIHPDWRKIMTDYFTDLIVGKNSRFDIEYKIIRPIDKEERWIHGIGDLKFNANFQPVTLVATIQDITHIKQSESLLKQRNEELQIAKAKAEESEEKFKTYTQILPIGIYTTNANGECVYANNKWLEIAGLTLDESLGYGWTQAIHPDDKELVSINWNKFVQTNSNWIYEYRFIGKHGKITWVEANAKALYNKENQLVGYLGSNVDITDRKKAANEIIQANERYELIGKATNDGIWDWELETNKIWANEMHQQLYGLTMHDPVPDSDEWRRRIHPSERELIVKNFEEALLSNQKKLIDEYRFHTENGGWMNVYGRTLIERNAEGKAIRLIGSMMDVTESKKIEDAIKASEEKYRTLVEQASDAIFISNLDGRFLMVNSSLCKLSQYTEKEILQLNFYDFVIADDLEKNPFHFEELKKGKTVLTERLIKAKNNSTICVEINAKLLKDGRLLVFVRDISDRKKAEEEIKETTGQLRRLTAHLQDVRDLERRRIGREIHDELGQQLTAVKMDVVWIEKKCPVDATEVKNKIRNIIDLLDNTNQSIRRILIELRPDILDDHGLLEAMEWQGRQFTSSTEIPIQFYTSGSEIDLPEQFSTCIFRVYQEALTNIMRYAQAKKVLISLSLRKKFILLIIEDDGKGFNMEKLKNSKSFGILGMKERVLSLNGKFELDSKPGMGTKIRIILTYNS
jgi:PAS domain S-box-containing protein